MPAALNAGAVASGARVKPGKASEAIGCEVSESTPTRRRDSDQPQQSGDQAASAGSRWLFEKIAKEFQ
jgi:hypothetical protein